MVVVGTRVWLFRAVTGDGDGLDLLAFRGLIAARLPVGRCGCAPLARVYGVDASPVGRRWWLTVRCDTCGRETATPVDRPATAQAA